MLRNNKNKKCKKEKKGFDEYIDQYEYDMCIGIYIHKIFKNKTCIAYHMHIKKKYKLHSHT